MREKAEKTLVNFKTQRDNLVAQLGKVEVAIATLEYLLKEDPAPDTTTDKAP